MLPRPFPASALAGWDVEPSPTVVELAAFGTPVGQDRVAGEVVVVVAMVTLVGVDDEDVGGWGRWQELRPIEWFARWQRRTHQ